MANIIHTVVIRDKDLGLAPGLLAAQTAHIGDAFEREKLINDKKASNLEKEWMADPYIHVLSVANLEELEIISAEAKAAGLVVHEWRDLIPSKNLKRDIPNVFVGCSIGPCDLDKVKAICGGLPYAGKE